MRTLKPQNHTQTTPVHPYAHPTPPSSNHILLARPSPNFHIYPPVSPTRLPLRPNSPCADNGTISNNFFQRSSNARRTPPLLLPSSKNCQDLKGVSQYPMARAGMVVPLRRNSTS